MRSGDLVPEDAGDTSEDFINIALERALPGVPEYQNFEIDGLYIFEPRTAQEMCDPDNGYDSLDRVFAKHKSWVVLTVHKHVWISCMHLFEHLEAKHPGFGRWLCYAIESPFTISPRDYVGWVSSAHWYGENDEEMAKGEYEGENAGTPVGEADKWEGPTRKEFDALVPKWAQHTAKVKRAERLRFLRTARRILGVNCHDLFDGRGKPLFAKRWEVAPPGSCMDANMRPVAFGWNNADLVQQSIDYCFETAQSSSGCSDVFAVLPADDLTACADRLRSVFRVLDVYDNLVNAFNRYRAKYKIA